MSETPHQTGRYFEHFALGDVIEDFRDDRVAEHVRARARDAALAPSPDLDRVPDIVREDSNGEVRGHIVKRGRRVQVLASFLARELHLLPEDAPDGRAEELLRRVDVPDERHRADQKANAPLHARRART